jgi:hypothetical protein
MASRPEFVDKRLRLPFADRPPYVDRPRFSAPPAELPAGFGDQAAAAHVPFGARLVAPAL